jgi:chromosome segregation ATPase
MIDKLTQEKEDEIKKKDYCVETITEVDSSDLPSKQRDRADLEVVIEDLHMNIDQLSINVEELKAAVAEAQTQLKRAGIDREKANQEFQVVVADQRATGKLLTASLNILKGFYDKAALLQAQKKTAQPAGPPPPPGFKTYEKSSSSGGVMGMMQSIINDAKAMEEEAVRGEKDAQADYEKFVQETNASVDAMNTDMSNKGGAKAKAESDLVERQAELNGVLDTILKLESDSKDIHYECDFLLKNFDLRQSTRDDEIYSLQQSLAIFSGASFGAFLQGH